MQAVGLGVRGSGLEAKCHICTKIICIATSGMTASQEKPFPDIISVLCMDTLEDCPDSQLNDEYCQSIGRFLGSEQHLAHRSFSTWNLDFRVTTCTRTLCPLWENPANYVRKHLGLMNYWKRSNGTIVWLSRIH